MIPCLIYCSPQPQKPNFISKIWALFGDLYWYPAEKPEVTKSYLLGSPHPTQFLAITHVVFSTRLSNPRLDALFESRIHESSEYDTSLRCTHDSTAIELRSMMHALTLWRNVLNTCSCSMNREMRTLSVSYSIPARWSSQTQKCKYRTTNDLNATTSHDETSADTSREVAGQREREWKALDTTCPYPSPDDFWRLQG